MHQPYCVPKSHQSDHFCRGEISQYILQDLGMVPVLPLVQGQAWFFVHLWKEWEDPHKQY